MQHIKLGLIFGDVSQFNFIDVKNKLVNLYKQLKQVRVLTIFHPIAVKNYIIIRVSCRYIVRLSFGI